MPELVTVSIPTLNSGKNLASCLDAVLKQSYDNLEINIIDGNSQDNTVAIARQKSITKIISYPHALLGARFEGAKNARGQYILLLDSDQVLTQDAIARAVELMRSGFEMLVLEETSCKAETLTEKLFCLDRQVIHQARNLKPESGALLARFFKKDLLLKAFNQIPPNLMEKVSGEDHLIIYYQAWQLSQKVGFLPQAVCHLEPRSLRQVVKSAYRWGYTSQDAELGKYQKLLARETKRLSLSLSGPASLKAKSASLLLLLIRGIAGKSGFYHAKLKQWLKRFQS